VLVAPSDVGNLYFVRLLYKIRPIEKQLPSAREIKTRQEADPVGMFVDLYAVEMRTRRSRCARWAHARARGAGVAGCCESISVRPEALEEATAPAALAPAPCRRAGRAPRSRYRAKTRASSARTAPRT
jgi:ATP-dependent RNA helicase DeaD